MSTENTQVEDVSEEEIGSRAAYLIYVSLIAVGLVLPSLLVLFLA